MKALLPTIVLCGFLVTACRSAPSPEQDSRNKPRDVQPEEILTPLIESVDAWNSGDLERFMDAYEASPETTFVGAEVAKGTAAVLARYRRDYPDQDHMGRTEFSELEARPLSDDLAIVTGRYRLERSEEYGGPAHGIFTLVMRKSDDGWRIIHDQSARLP
jgi:uncharacterized protein (TIGR02246 family)